MEMNNKIYGNEGLEAVGLDGRSGEPIEYE